MRPVFLASLRVETVNVPAEVRNVDQPVDDCGRGDRPPDLVELPHLARLSDVSPPGGVDAIEMAHTLAVLRVLAVANEDSVLENDRRGDQLVSRLRP